MTKLRPTEGDTEFCTRYRILQGGKKVDRDSFYWSKKNLNMLREIQATSRHKLQSPTPSINQLFGTIQQIGHT